MKKKMHRMELVIAILFLLFQIEVSAWADANVEFSDELFYSPGNPRYFHADESCMYFGTLYLPMMSIERNNPLFPYMKRCPYCMEPDGNSDDRFLPWLWSIEEKAEEMPEYYSIPDESMMNIYDITRIAVDCIKQSGDNPANYIVYTNYHRGIESFGQCYSVIFATPRIDTEMNTLFFDLGYEVFVSPASGELLTLNRGR